jgi:S1-C subfamily serine protease
MCAHQFFTMLQDPDVAAAIGRTVEPNRFDPWSVADFSKYLHTLGLRDAGNAVALDQILGAMQRAGLLLALGWESHLPLMGQRYITQGGASPGQLGGNLWLSEVFGAALIIPSYNLVTIQLSGSDAEGNPCGSWGTGLILDHTHIVTNKHVVTALAETSASISVHPSSNRADAEQVNCTCIAHPHPELDVAVIEAQMPAGKGLPRLVGMAFRDPAWADEVYLFGYPRVPMIVGTVITVQRGEVVNPAAETPATADHGRQKTFLYSAIARPGNSGGPIVAHDGRVIGLVVEDSSEVQSTDTSADEPTEDGNPAQVKRTPAAAPFYRGIPSSEVIRALDDLGFGGIAKFDEPPYGPAGGSSVQFRSG